MTAHQPVIQTLDNGSVIQLRANGENGKIRLDGDLALGELIGVDRFQYPKMKNAPGNLPNVVAAPEFKLREVHWSAAVKDGETILIDPVFTKLNQKWIKDPTVKSGVSQPIGRVVILLTPRFIDIEPAIKR